MKREAALALALAGTLATPFIPASTEPVPVAGAEPAFATPTTLDRIGRILVPVTINGLGPFRMLVDTWRQRLPGRFHVVEYESLVCEPELELSRAMRFCGLDPDPACVDITRNKSPVTTASSSQVRQPLNRRGIGAWRRYRKQLQPLMARLVELGIEVD